MYERTNLVRENDRTRRDLSKRKYPLLASEVGRKREQIIEKVGR